jgi:hypothetical protein
MMRFPIGLIYNERNDKFCSENSYDFFATIPRIELGLKQAAAVYTPGSIQYDDSKQTVIQKSQDDSPHFRMWIDSLLNNDWIARCKDIMLVRSFKYYTIMATKYDLQNKVANTKTSIFTEIAKGVKNSEN